MHKRQVKALLTVRPEICRDLIVIYVIDSLITKRIFTNEEKNHILRSSQTIGDVNCPQFREEVLKRQTESFLNLLTQKVEENANAFDGFVNILYKDDNYPWIAKKLQQALEDLFFKESNIEIDANQIKTISHDVPNQVKNLLKRPQKIEEIRDELKAFALKGNGWLVLYGMGGSGKSVLAAEAVREWDCDDYKDGIWWTNCGQMLKDNKFDYSMLLLKLQFLWDRFCENYSYKHQKFECVESAVHKIKSFLNSHRKSLLVLDDVWNKEVLENFDFGVPVLFTARDITSDIIPPKFIVKKLKTIDNKDYGLSTNESRQLLAFWINADPNDLHNEYVNKIIEKLKGNPLCLTLIGNCMEDKGNDLQFWKFYEESIENSREQRSPRRRSNSGRFYSIYESFGFESLVKHSYDALTEEMRNYFKYFALFLEDIRIPVKVFETVLGVSQCQIIHIMDKLVNKSLVLKTKTNELTLYTVHDIILNFLKTQCSNELEALHGELLDRYFDLCRTESGQIEYSRLPNDGYIYYFLGYHIYKANRLHLFPQIYLDLSFVAKKIRNTGPSDLLNDYFYYKEHFENHSSEYQDFVRFVSTNADLLCDLNIDVIQLSLCEPIDSKVHMKSLAHIGSTDKLYLKWCNQPNVKTSKILSTKLHSGSVRYAIFSPNRSLIVSVGSDKLVRVWDSKTGKLLKTMKGHQNTINCCQFNSDGSSLITASDDGTVKVWSTDCNFSNGELLSPRPRSGSDYPHFYNGSCDFDDSLHTYVEHSDSESNDNQIEVKCCAFSHNNNLVVSGGSDLNPRVWFFDGMNTKYILKGHKHTVQSCQFSSNSELIITSSADEVIVWCANRAQVLKTLKHEKVVENCLFSGDLNYIFTSSGKYVYKWSSRGSNNPLSLYNSLKTNYYVTCCAVSPNGQYIAAGTTTDQIIIWSNNTFLKSAVATFKGSDQITCINFNNESTQLLSCSVDGTVIIWDTSKAFGASMVGLRKKFAVQNYKSKIKVLTPDDNGTIRLFEGFEGKENKTLTLNPNPRDISAPNGYAYDITCCALSSNLDILFGTSDGELILHQTFTNETHFLEKHEKEVSFCAFVNGLNRFVTASKDSTFRNYNNYSRQYTTPKYETDKDLPMGPIINCKIFSRESKAMIWCENASLFVIDLRKNRLIARCVVCEGSQINSADVTHNEELIATVSSDKSVTLWRSNIKSIKTKNNENPERLETNEIYSIRTLKTEDIPRSCRFSPNGNFLAIGDDSGKIQIWNFHGTESYSLQVFNDSHSDWVNDIAISPKGSLIISISKSIKLWTNEGKLLQTFKTNGGSMSSIYTHFINNQSSNSDDFNTIITVDDAGVLYILQLMNFRE